LSERISIPGPAGNLDVLMEQARGAESYAVISFFTDICTNGAMP